ncbi:crossover junction endodeoxyribonuclease RuvC [Candidatus Peribacteria bacterium RIFCSPHIGHO2_01_FULL_51_9]|nr:MAG: crossover junction endodeoxyribonuclease RuvC [Candidatus Peribacteria bacterium RIFCSPHIGHO2_01_FULL_51_9]
MRILGIDPGLATIGLGLIEAKDMYNITVLEWLTITTDSHTPFPQRIVEIARDLSAFIDEAKPDLAVVEQLFFATNEQTAIAVAHARGVIVLTVAQKNIPLIEPAPLQLKSGLTGDGRADKRQIQDMLCHMLHLTEIPKPDDAADALALAVFGALKQQSSMLTKIT